MDVNKLREVMRQRAGLPPSAGGQATGGQSPGATSSQGATSGPPPGTMSEQPMAQLQKSQPSEAMLIIKGLVNRLRSLPGGMQPNGQSNSS